MARPRSYFNSGLFYINVDYWTHSRAGERVIELIAGGTVNTPLHDQDYLNLCFGDLYQRLDLRWNFTWPMSYIVPRLRPFIVHFAGRLKPWDEHEWRCPRRFSSVYSAVFAELPDSVLATRSELGFNEWERKNLKRQALKARLGRKSGASWNPNHSKAIDGWCG